MEWIMSGGLIAIIALILANNRDIDHKIKRTYGRLDEVKDYQDKTFTRQDICSLTHNQVNEKLDRIEGKLDKVLNGK